MVRVSNQEEIRLPAWIEILLPTLQDIFFLALFAAVIGLGPRLMNIDGDLGRHLTIGEYILSSRQVPDYDLFSHTLEGQHLVDHEWLSQVVFAAAHRVGGLNGVVWLCALLISVTFTMTYRQCYQRSQLLLVALFWAVAAAAAASLHWLARPHLFTLLFINLWTVELEQLRQGKLSRAWSLPVLMLFWANLHGAFIAGFAVWGLYLVGAAIDWLNAGQEKGNGKRVLLVMSAGGLAAFVTSLLNPGGIHLWGTSLGYLRNRYMVGHTAEYLPPDFHLASAWPFLAMIAASLLLLSLTRTRLPTAHALLLTVWTVMGLYSIRNVPLYAVLAAPVLAGLTSELIRSVSKPVQSDNKTLDFIQFDARLARVENRLHGWLWPVVFLVIITMALGRGVIIDFEQQGNRFSPTVFPVQAMEWLEGQDPPGQVFNYFPWGGYLLYSRWPELRVFIDGQTDFYGEDLTRQYEQVITLTEGWKQVLIHYKVGWVIMPANAKLVQALEADPGWQVVYEDDTAAILFRTP